MKWRCLFLTILCLTGKNMFAQIAYQDSKGINNNCVDVQGNSFSFKTDQASVHTLVAYLRNYLPESARNNLDLTEDPVLAQFEDNPFFGAQIRKLREGGASPNRAGILSTAVSSVGALNVTTVADGIARFLVARTKAELDVYFFEQFKDFLNNKEYGKDLKILFPNTHSVMQLAGDEIYNYQQYLQAFREAFGHDLSALLINSNTWINMDSSSTKLVGLIHKSTLYPYLQLALQLAVDLQQGKHPGDILKDLSAKDFSNASTWGDFESILKTSNVFSQSLRSTTTDHYWITADEFSAFKDITFTKIYFGLIYQQAKLSQIGIAGTNLTEILEPFATKIKDGQQAVDNLRPLMTEIDQVLKQLKGDSERGIAENYILLSGNILKVLSAVKTGLLPTDASTILPEGSVEDAEFMLTHATNLLADVRTKSYSAGIIELSLIIQKLNINESDFLKGMIKYGSFMANVATAKTSEEVKQAIEVVALPPGSYRVKRESNLNVSLNGYVGFYGGNEYMPASENENRFSAGIFAPVGFAFSRGGLGSSNKKGGKSISFFASIIDLGALASFRFNDDQTNVASDIKLKDIVAPGTFLIYGFGKSPICIGAGAQLGPALRDVDTGGTAKINEDYYVRVAGFIVVDIPFFNLYNRKDKKK